MPQHHKVHELLDSKELEEFEAYAREPGRTIDECHEWLQVRGYVLSRAAVGNWKRRFDEQVLAERFSRSAELARAIKGAVEGGQFEDIADAAVMQLTQVVFSQAAKLETDGQLDPLDVQRMTRSVVNLVGSKAGLSRLLAEKFDRAMQAKLESRPQGGITAEDIADARKAIFGD